MTPHDALFKAVFSQPERAAEELRFVLEPEVAALVDFSSLSLEPGSFVDEALRERHADLLFSARLAGRPAKIYVLLEHQSRVDPWMPLRRLGYMLRIWEAHLEATPAEKRLPAIVPVVVHHSETGWRAARCFEALVDAPDAASPYVPRFRFALDDLGGDGAAALAARTASASTRLVLSALQQARTIADLGRLLLGWRDLLREVNREPDGRRALELVFRYLFEVRGRHEFAAIDIKAVEIGLDEERTMETMADYLRSQGWNRGLQEGLQEGLVEGRRELLLHLLQRRFGELPAQVVGLVQATGDHATLERWADRLLDAKDIAEVFQPR